MNEIGCREIVFGSAGYDLACELRQEMLRVPLGMNLYDEDLSAEAGQRHFGLFDGGELVACVIAVHVSREEVKLRQMAVSAARQGEGLGRQILCEVERRMVEKGYAKASLHARVSALGFYEKVGYAVVSEEFMEIGIPHRKMEKRLNRE